MTFLISEIFMHVISSEVFGLLYLFKIMLLPTFLLLVGAWGGEEMGIISSTKKTMLDLKH